MLLSVMITMTLKATTVVVAIMINLIIMKIIVIE